MKRGFVPVLGAAVVLSLLPGATPVVTDAAAQTRTVTLVGDLQDELGCAEDWQPTCEATILEGVAGSESHYESTFEVPAGSYEFKVALDQDWEESYPADNLPLILAGDAALTFTFDGETGDVRVAAAELSGPSIPADADLAGTSLRESLTGEQFYFVLADRFANGDESNDRGGIEGDRMDHGFDPTDHGFFHGGDLRGIMDRLDYIEGLGTTAIWLTPSFKNQPVQGDGDDASAGYHGYWVTDFTQIDPHLGTNEEMRELVDAAHARGMKVFFDIITNHTADIIDYEEGQYSYISKEDEPYRDAAGDPFDDRDYVGGSFPELDPATSFPYTPVFRSEADASIKVPAWLNDPTMYHNRGDSTWAGESNTYGDFFGLDDLFTEREEVVDGMIEIYSAWAEFGIDGFRIDTVKHVNMEFWQEFSPRVLEAAREDNEDFFMFGEVFDSNPAYLSTFTTEGELQAVLDFGFQSRAINFARGAGTSGLEVFYAADDYYTHAGANAYQLPTFTGNHDMGRAAMMIQAGGFSGDELQARVELSNELMFLLRGQPVVYYGDEQGFIGTGGDKESRQSLFATQVASYAAEPVIGGESGSMDRYDTAHPLYQQIADLAELRAEHPALVDGAQIHRYSDSDAGIYAASRIDADQQVEYVVALNNATSTQTAAVETFTSGTGFQAIHGTTGSLTSDTDGVLEIEVPALSGVVYRADASLADRTEAPSVNLATPGNGGTVGQRAEIRAELAEDAFVQTTFAYRPVGTEEWSVLGTDDNAPYRVFHDVRDVPNGTLLEYRAVVLDHSGNISAHSSSAVVGEESDGGFEPVPVEQPDAVSVPGSHNAAMGCGGDWDPGCAAAQLELDERDGIWKGSYEIPEGDYEYKAAINGSWDENYGAGGERDGANIGYGTEGGEISFYYDHSRTYVTSTAEGPIITAPGSMQAALGCPGDWSPDCMLPWLVDADGDGVYTWSSTAIPAGNYEMKVAHGLSWSENYGAGGVLDGPNIGFAVPRDGVQVTILYTLETHEIEIVVSEPGVALDLRSAKAHWLAPDLIAWPAAGAEEAAEWNLHFSEDADLSVNPADGVTGGSSLTLSLDENGLPDETLEQFPHLDGYLALRLDAAEADRAADILRGQFAVSMSGDQGQLLDATGVQIPGVLDSLYADAAAGTELGITWNSPPTLRLWAPTAQDVTLLLWEKGSAGEPQRVEMTRADDGSWSVTGEESWNGMEYRYEVRVFAPSTGNIETNSVTDPYSVGLTLNSTRSVIVDLADPQWMPEGWATSTGPALDSEVDQTIYELHVRDFSISDPDVPEELRGSYLAFAEDGYGRRHLEALAEAGLNTVHLLPTFDIASIEEDPELQTTPDCDLASFEPDSTEQQACVVAQANTDAFNWGYDPYHYSTPEGSYASSAENAWGGRRAAEFRTMVSALHDIELRVVLDKVYNHTAASGQNERSVLDRVVPGYYHRLNSTGAVETSTCCENVATEHAMAEKLMVDSVVTWARDYRVDGFRFDLMGHHSRENMEAVRAALDELTVAADGIDGSQITLYGEGWDFGEVSGNARFQQAIQGQLEGTDIGTFNDRLRDGVRGGGPFDEDHSAEPGFASGGTSANDTDLVQIGLAGNLRGFEFRSQETGELVTGAEVDYNGAPAGYAEHPNESVNYVDAHDNETLFDILTFKLPADTPMADRVRANTLALSTTALSQSPSFWHAGADLLRSKSLDRDSYNSGDWFNLLDFTKTENGFGRGLPPAEKNQDSWDLMRPLLADAENLTPSPEDIELASQLSAELLELRFSSPLFRLGDPELISQKLSFPVSGTEAGSPQVIVMHIDDTLGTDVDPELERLLVVFNGGAETWEGSIPGLEGAELELSQIQRDGVDDVVKASSWDEAAGAVSVPALSVAVFVERTEDPEPTPSPSPTGEPTSSPTPTGAPTSSPTPTGEPTSSPTPTGEPTSSPTPTGEPTGSPTPTSSPTVTTSPTSKPTSSATGPGKPKPKPGLPKTGG